MVNGELTTKNEIRGYYMNLIILLVLFFAILFAFQTQQGKVCSANGIEDDLLQKPFSVQMFLLSYALLGMMCFFCKSGYDMPVYAKFYTEWTLADLSSVSVEPGDKLLFMFIRLFIKNPYVGIGVIKLISIGIVYRSVYLIRDRICVGRAITAYVLLLYIFNFHLLRMMLALGLVFLAMAKEITGKRLQCIIYLCCAFMFHYSSIIVLLTYVCYILFRKNFTILKAVFAILLITGLYTNIGRIIGLLVSSIGVFQKYAGYSDVSVGTFGIVQLLLFIPTLIILICGYVKNCKDDFYKLEFFLGIMTFFAGSLGYVYKVASRVVYYFYFFYISYAVAAPLKNREVILKCGKLRIRLTSLMFIVYLLMQFYIYYIRGNYFASNGLTKYVFIWEN